METELLQKHPVNVKEEFDPSSSVESQSLQNPPLNVNEQFDLSASMENESLHHPLNVNEELDPSCMEHQSLLNPSLNVDGTFDPSLVENKSSLDPPLNGNEDITPMDLNAGNNPVTSDTSDTSSMPEQHVGLTSEACLRVSHPETHSSATAPIAEEIPGSSLKNMWSSIGLPETYHTHPIIPTTLQTSSAEVCLVRPQLVTEQPAQLIDLESDIPEEDTTKDLLNRHTSHMPFFNPFPNRDRNELHSLIKREGYHQEQKKPGSEFHPTNVLLEPANPFPGHFREQLQPPFALEHHRQKAQSELYMHPSIQDNIYSDNSRYSVQGPEQFSSVNVRDWSNATRLPNPVQPSQLSSGELLNHNWFATENRAHGGWSSSDATVFQTQSLGSTSTGDQSLYSVLTQCNLRSRGPYSPVGSTEQMIPPTTNYGQEIPPGIPMTSNPLPQTVSPFDYLSGGEASSTLKNPSMGWMSLGHQPSTLHDPSGKPFLKSWNQ